MTRRGLLLSVLLLCGLTGAAAADPPFIILQSTTSTQNSGLLDYLLPRFTEQSGISVRVVAVGTGQALTNARKGDGDVLLVHARAEEEEFVAAGFGVARYDVMYNDFVIIGPQSDPAGIRGSPDAASAFRTIAAQQAIFVSRGDDSGTHIKELEIWKAASVDAAAASGSWYRETGSGMGATLNTAVGMGGYVLSDRATWISYGNKSGFEILVEGDPVLFNQYGVIMVNPDRHPHVKATESRRFLDWILGPHGQRAIADYQLDGQQLFFPNAAPR